MTEPTDKELEAIPVPNMEAAVIRAIVDHRVGVHPMVYAEFARRQARLLKWRENEVSRLTDRIENALAALGLHPDSQTDIAEEIHRIRQEGRDHFHALTRLQEKR